jgi:hypothetical protein
MESIGPFAFTGAARFLPTVSRRVRRDQAARSSGLHQQRASVNQVEPAAGDEADIGLVGGNRRPDEAGNQELRSVIPSARYPSKERREQSLA